MREYLRLLLIEMENSMGPQLQYRHTAATHLFPLDWLLTTTRSSMTSLFVGPGKRHHMPLQLLPVLGSADSSSQPHHTPGRCRSPDTRMSRLRSDALLRTNDRVAIMSPTQSVVDTTLIALFT